MNQVAFKEKTIKCNRCGTEINTNTQSSLVSCQCKAISVDGSNGYVRVLGKEKDYSEAKKPTTNKKLSKKQIENSIFEGDCLEAMSRFPDQSVDMILCDLPYGTTQNKWDSIIPLDALWKEYERIIKVNGVIALTSQGVFTAQLIMSNPTLFKYKLAWVKSKATNFLNAKKQPLRKYEDVCIFYRNKIYQPTYHPQMSIGEPYNKGHRKSQMTGSYGEFSSTEVKSDGQRYPSDVIYFKTAESEGEVFHPTQKPIELGQYLIRTYTNKGELVLDNTSGSGSFLVAAALEGRKFVGIELNKETILHKKKNINLIEVTKNRILKFLPKLKINIYGNS
jgi:site-specific DNA-methyltransferase (adenine-specific)